MSSKLGGTRPTIRDVARVAGVSVGTASRVLNGNVTVSGTVRLQVERAILELGYQPNAVAQSMRLGTTHSVGVVLRDITVPIFADLASAIEGALEGDGYSLLLACSEDKKERELAILRMFGQRKVDGLIMTTCSEQDPDIMLARSSVGAPIIFMDRDVPGSDSVAIAHRAGTRQATELLLKLGHRRIGLITGSPDLYPGRERSAGYAEAFATAGLSVDMSFVRAENFMSETSFSSAMDLLGGERRATAIVAGGFNLLPAVLRAVRQRNLSIPDDVSVIAGADSELAQLASPAVTAINWDMASVGRAAARLLLQRLSYSSVVPPRRLHFPTDLLVRASCAPPKPDQRASRKTRGRVTA